MDTASLLISGAVGVVTSAITAYYTAHLKLRHTRAEWARELSMKLAEASVAGRDNEQALARQFAIGFVVIELAGERDKVFIAPNTRITAGRDPSNTIVLSTLAASRRHFALVSDQTSVYVEDLGAANGVFVNQRRVSGRTRLEDFDVIRIGAGGGITFHYLAQG